MALQGQTEENGSMRAQHEQALSDVKALVAKNDELTNQLANLVHENEGYKTAPGLKDRFVYLEKHALELEQTKAALQQELTAAREKADLEYKGRAAAEVLVNDLREKMQTREEELATESTRKDEEDKAKKEKAWKAENLKHTKWLEKNNKELQDKELALKELLESSAEDLKHSQVDLQAMYLYTHIYIYSYIYVFVRVCESVCEC